MRKFCYQSSKKIKNVSELLSAECFILHIQLVYKVMTISWLPPFRQKTFFYAKMVPHVLLCMIFEHSADFGRNERLVQREYHAICTPKNHNKYSAMYQQVARQVSVRIQHNLSSFTVAVQLICPVSRSIPTLQDLPVVFIINLLSSNICRWTLSIQQLINLSNK